MTYMRSVSWIHLVKLALSQSAVILARNIPKHDIKAPSPKDRLQVGRTKKGWRTVCLCTRVVRPRVTDCLLKLSLLHWRRRLKRQMKLRDGRTHRCSSRYSRKTMWPRWWSLEKFEEWYGHTSLLADSIGLKDKVLKLRFTHLWGGKDFRKLRRDAGRLTDQDKSTLCEPCKPVNGSKNSFQTDARPTR